MKAVKSEKTESEDKPQTKKRGQVKKKQLDIELGGRKQASNKRESRPRNGRKKDDEKEEKADDKKTEKTAPPAQTATQVQAQVPVSSNAQQSQPGLRIVRLLKNSR